MQPVFAGGFLAVLLVTLALFFGDFGVALASPRGQVTWQLLIYGGAAVLAVLLRDRLATPRARTLTAFLFLWFSYGLFHGLVGIRRGATDMDWGSALVSGTLLATVGAMTLMPGLWWTVPVHAAAWAACLAWPEHGFLAFAVMFWVNAPIVLRASYLEFTRPTAT
jgi:hypothetical protein